MGLFSGLGKVVSGLTGGLIDFGGGQANMATQAHYNRKEMDKANQLNRDFTRDQYELMMEGLDKAGLNPALAAGGGLAGAQQGASALGVGMPTQQGAMENLKTATGLDVQRAQKDNIEADTELKEKQAGKTDTEIELNKIEREFKPKLAQAEIALKNAESQKAKQEAHLKATETIKQNMINAYNATFGTNPDQSTLERFSSIATTLVYDLPRKGIDYVLNKAIDAVKHRKKN